MAPTTQEAIASYVTDMLALEDHIETAVKGQIEDLKDETALVSELTVIQQTCRRHIETLEQLATRREETGQGLSKIVKRAASSLLGVGAAAVDFVRTEKLPKNLRDDYTAVSLAVIGYIMLHTTALSLGDEEVADIAHAHLQAHAKNVMSLHNVTPVAVMRYLEQEGHDVRFTALMQIERNIQSVWESEDGVTQPADSAR
jgi:ferritin-like metal-binding protein YciE